MGEGDFVSKRIVLMMTVMMVCMLLLGSCFFGGRGMIFDDTGAKADRRMEQIMEAIKNKDKEALKALFSDKALAEAEDFDNRVDYLLDFLEGDIDSYERDGLSADGSIRQGKESQMIRSGYRVVTEEEEYFFYVVDYDPDTIDPDNAGVYMIQVTKWADSNNLGPWQERLSAGISLKYG